MKSPEFDELLKELSGGEGEVAKVALDSAFERAKAQLAANIGQYQRSTQIAALEFAATVASAVALPPLDACALPFALLLGAAASFSVAGILALASVSPGQIHYPGTDANFWVAKDGVGESVARARTAVLLCVHEQIEHNLSVSRVRAKRLTWSIRFAGLGAVAALAGAVARTTLA